MIMNEKNQELISHFIEQLESFGIDIGTNLDRIEKERQDYEFFQRMREELETSKLDFCSTYFELEEEEKEECQKRLLRLFKDREIVDNIVQEIINLYYLKDTGLLDLEEITPQKEIALENLETLSTKIEKYLLETNIDQLSAEEERLSSTLDKIVDLGSIMEGEESSPIEDIAFLEEVLESSNLTQEEKKALLKEVIAYNLKRYQELLEQKSKEVEQAVEQSKEEGRIELEELKSNPTISPECMKRIDELLSKKEIIQKIVRIVNDDFTMTINITSPTPEEKDQIESSIELAREDMIASIEEDSNLTPEEALEKFFQKYDETLRHKKQLLGILFEEAEESTRPREEQEEIVKMGLEFFEYHKQLVHQLSKEDKERIHQYMKDLYQKKENREIIYESKSYVSDEEVEKEAAYEIQVIKELLEAVGEEDQEMYAKISQRIEDILECVNQKGKEETPIAKDEGNMFFLMKTNDEAQIESDLGLNSRKGIPQQFYADVYGQLEAIANRGERNLIAAQPVNPAYKYIRKLGVRYTTGVRTKVFFIPVGKKDAIIIGASFMAGKDILKEQDMKIKRHLSQIEALKERLTVADTYEEESIHSATIKERIMSALDSKELEDMFEEVTPTDENHKTK